MPLRGNKIIKIGEQWFFADNHEPVDTTWETKPCAKCTKGPTPEGHDHCLGTLPGLMNACCGHGSERSAYVQFLDGVSIHGPSATIILEELKQYNKDKETNHARSNR